MIIFIVTGRLGENLVYYKTMPVAAIPTVSQVYVFTVHNCRPIEKVIYINHPKWFRHIKPKGLLKIIQHLFEPLQILFYAIKKRPFIINGVYTLPKGLNSIVISKLTGSHGVLSVIGGKREMDTLLFPKKLWRSVNWWIAREATAITTKGSHDNQYFISNGINPEKIFSFNGCIDLARFYDPGAGRDIDLIFVGSFYELKGPDRIVEVIAIIQKSLPNLKVYMIGSGVDLQKTIQKARMLNLEDTISFPGFIKAVESYCIRAKLLILMSRSEGNPNCMLEGMACGCVPVVPDVGNIRETIISNYNGVLMSDCYDIEGYASQIICLLTNEQIRGTLAENGKKTVKEKFSVEVQSRDFEMVINYINNTKEK